MRCRSDTDMDELCAVYVIVLFCPVGVSVLLFGASWGHFSPTWSRLGAILAPSLAGLGPSGAVLGPSWGRLGPAWAVLEPSWGHLGASWGLLGRSWGHL